jgi:FkbM family methyltransferase
MTEEAIAIFTSTVNHAAEPPRRGAFSAVRVFGLSEGKSSNGIAERLKAAELARQAGCKWMIALRDGERLSPDALELVAPSLDLFDAIFGAAHVRSAKEAVAKLSRLAFDSSDRLPHALLNWWVPDSHIVRTDVAADVIDRVAKRADSEWAIDYLFEIWGNARCLKTAQPLLVLDDPPSPRSPAERQAVLKRLAENPIYFPIVYGEDVYQMPYTGMNAGIEREQTRGLFFEAFELEELRKLVGPGATIVDVGANTGNHTIFFAGPMKAAKVTPFEPLPRATAALRASVTRNKLVNVDLSLLGTGISDRAGRARLTMSERGGMGATGLVADSAGAIAVQTLDSIIADPVDLLKIDVEGMELQALAGAKELIRRNRPLIFIEIANENTLEFSAWLKEAEYRVARIFPDKGHANYLIEPGETASR